MGEAIYKILENCEVKKVAEREYEFTASTMDMDRDGEIIDVEGWDLKNFKKNPVIMYAHDYRTLPIGKATKIGIKDGKLINNVEFPPEGTYEFADIVERLVSTGYLKTESVGFIPRKWEDGDGEKGSARRTYTKQELLEISIVPIPSNPNALREAVEKGVITTKQFDSITKEPDIVTKPEETNNYYRIPVPGEEGKHTDHKIRTMDVSKDKGIKGLYCTQDKKIITYMFDKEKWGSMKECQDWVKEHMGKRSVSQVEIRDELDYLDSIIEQSGLSKETAFDAVDVAIRIMARAWPYHKWESITLGVNFTKENNPIIFNRLVDDDSEEKQCEVTKMNMGKMQEMHDMMQSCESMANKAKKMSEDMMSEDDMPEDDDMKRIPASDIAVKEDKPTPEEIQELLSQVKF